MYNIIDYCDVSPSECTELFKLTEDIISRPNEYKNSLNGAVLAALFFEPSTRTIFSFSAAMQRLGGGVFTLNDPAVTSAAKGETFKDTIIMTSGYSDIVVIRHPREGAAFAASLYASCPVVNAGDGGHFHPTQTLTDMATLHRLRGSNDNFHIALCGDLKYGRTVHSLIGALTRQKGISVTLISPSELALPRYYQDILAQTGIPFTQITSLEDNISHFDILYMTRIQRERFADPVQYERLKNSYTLTAKTLQNAKKDLIILHPLPRNDEIHQEVDSDARAKYFLQAQTGMYVRMALLLTLCKNGRRPATESFFHATEPCKNPNCITAAEQYLPPMQNNVICRYCG